jgi:hypothetical protein
MGETTMKFLMILCLISSFAWSKTIKDFNKAIYEDASAEIKKDQEKFKKSATRGPASVEVVPESKIEEESKIDKNVRQIGPKNW